MLTSAPPLATTHTAIEKNTAHHSTTTPEPSAGSETSPSRRSNCPESAAACTMSPAVRGASGVLTRSPRLSEEEPTST